MNTSADKPPPLPDSVAHDIDVMRDVYMSREQRAAYERILAALTDGAEPVASLTSQWAAGLPLDRIAYGHQSHDWMASKVRMLMRNDLDHEAVCTGARDRIVWLAARVKELEAAPRPSAALVDGVIRSFYERSLINEDEEPAFREALTTALSAVSATPGDESEVDPLADWRAERVEGTREWKRAVIEQRSEKGEPIYCSDRGAIFSSIDAVGAVLASGNQRPDQVAKLMNRALLLGLSLTATPAPAESLEVVCQFCLGDGYLHDADMICNRCNGSGKEPS